VTHGTSKAAVAAGNVGETLQTIDVRLDVAVPVRLESCDRAFERHKRAPEPSPGELVQWWHHAAV